MDEQLDDFREWLGFRYAHEVDQGQAWAISLIIDEFDRRFGNEPVDR